MAATAQILIEVDDTGAVSAFKAIGDAGAKIGPSLQSAKPALDNVTKGTDSARESAALLSEEFGVHMPRALRGVLAETPGVGAALNAAFTGLAVAGFIELVKSAVDNLTGFSAQLDIIKKQNEELMSSVGAANKILVGPQNLQQVREEIGKTETQIAQLKSTLGIGGDDQGFWDVFRRGLTRYSAANATLLDQLDTDVATVNKLHEEEARLQDIQTRTEPLEILKAQNAAREAGLRGIQAITQAAKDQANYLDQEVKKGTVSEALAAAQKVEINCRMYAQIDEFDYQHALTARQLTVQNELAYSNAVAATARGVEQIYLQRDARLQQITAAENAANDALEHEGLARTANFENQRKAIRMQADDQILRHDKQVLEEMAQADSEAAIAMAPPWARGYAQVQADYDRMIRHIREERADNQIDDAEAARLSADAWSVAFARTRDQLASDMEGFFDDLTSGNIGKRFKKMFEDLVFQMVATWILGMNQMRSAASTGFGGGPTGILGAILGIGGFGGIGAGAAGGAQGGISSLPGVITNWDNSGLAVPMSGIGMSAGQGGGIPGVVLPSGSSTGAAAGIGGLLSKIFPGGLSVGGLNISGPGLAALGLPLLINGIQRHGVLGAFEGAIGGALAGTAILPGIGTAIGWVVGLFSSIIGGLFGPHKGDIARTQVMEPLLAQIKVITDSYDVFQTDYNTGISELEKLRTDALAALRKIGGNQVKGNSAATNQRIDAAEQHLKDTEAERQRRAQTNFGPPQFSKGGYVHESLAGSASSAWRASAMHFASGGEVPAILHTGEFVLNANAVDRLGVQNLRRVNAGGDAGGSVHFHINAVDAKSFAQFLVGGGTKEIVRALRSARMEGMI